MSGHSHLHDKWWPPEAESAEAMTGPRASYLDALADDVGVDVPDAMTKAVASDLIDELQRHGDSEDRAENADR
jgi:hypothetical protein